MAAIPRDRGCGRLAGSPPDGGKPLPSTPLQRVVPKRDQEAAGRRGEASRTEVGVMIESIQSFDELYSKLQSLISARSHSDHILRTLRRRKKISKSIS